MTKINDSALLHLRKDKILKKIIDNTELKSRGKPGDVYNSLLSSIVSQQLSLKAAETIYGRFLDLFDGEPSPPKIIGCGHDELRACGFSNQKAHYVKNVATFFLDRPLENKYWKKLDDEEIINELSSIKGVGVWTVQMILMFTLNRPNVFPLDDLIIRNSIVKYYGVSSVGKEQIQDLHKIAEKWSPHKSLACLYLWAAKDGLKK